MDFEKIMAQAQDMQQKMQEQMQQDKEKRAAAEHVGVAGAGLVKVTLNGSFGVKGVSIDQDLLKEDTSLIEDLIAGAINDAVRKVQETHTTGMPPFPDGFKMPEGFNPFGQ